MSGRQKFKSESEALESALIRAQSESAPVLPEAMRGHLDAILDASESNTGVLAVAATLLVKKSFSPEQDARLHRVELAGGFSGRGLDERLVTPFMKRNKFPAMKSGAGWLTRSLEQSAPYDLKYPGKITPKKVKAAFLGAIDEVESGRASAEDSLVWLFAGLIRQRKAVDAIRFHRPKRLPISEIISRLCEHFAAPGRGASRLPTLAIHAVYQQLVAEVRRYQGCKLEPLESHTAPDGKTGMLGDVQVTDGDGNPVEVVEIKHGITLTAALVRDCRAKFYDQPVKTYYLLSTREKIKDEAAIKREIADINREHGCQMIVNGIASTLKYYLRLLADTDKFVNAYVNLLKTDPAVTPALKMAWNQLGGKERRPRNASPSGRPK